MEFLLYLALGACAGVLAGLFGVCGGIVIVPDLAQSDPATGGRHFVGLRLSHRGGKCHKFHDSWLA